MSERSLGLNRGWAQAADGPVHRRTADAEQLGQFGRAVGAGVAELEQVPGLVDGQLRLLPAQPRSGGTSVPPMGCKKPSTISGGSSPERPVNGWPVDHAATF